MADQFKRPGERLIWENSILVGEVMKDKRHKICIFARTKKGIRYIDIRSFYLHREKDEWFPERAGINFPIAIPEKVAKGEEPTGKIYHVFSDLAPLLREAYQVARNMELFDENNLIYIPTKSAKRRAEEAANEEETTND